MMRHAQLLLAGCCGLLCACGSSGEQASSHRVAFGYETSDSVVLEIRVENDGAPVPAASITVTRHIASVHQQDSAANSAETFYQAGTDAAGTCSARFRVPATVQTVDLVIQAPGLTGDYTVEALRGMAGPFAPSSRQLVVLDEPHQSINVTLQTEGT